MKTTITIFLCLILALVSVLTMPSGAVGAESEKNNPYNIFSDTLPDKLSNESIKHNSDRYCYGLIEQYNRTKNNTEKFFALSGIEYTIENNPQCFTDNFLDVLKDRFQIIEAEIDETTSDFEDREGRYFAKRAAYLRIIYKLMADDTINEIETEKLKNYRETINSLLN